MSENSLFKKRKMSTDTISDNLKDSNDEELLEILTNINKLNIDANKDLFLKIIKKIDDLSKKVDTLSMVNIKVDILKKNIDKILTEKDYIIENLRYEINDLKDQMKESKIDSEKDLDYFC